jgi:nucleoside-diphosphate-sugar epimerase
MQHHRRSSILALSNMPRPQKAYNLLVSGPASGLGNAVQRALGGVGLPRNMALHDPLIRDRAPFDAIIHCAVNAAKTITMENAFQYIDDNLFLTQRLLEVPHKKFIYLSSMDIYPRLGRAIAEDEDFDLSALVGPYAHAKLFSDLLVQRKAAKPLILRPATLLGPAMRPNTTSRMLTQRGCGVFLSAESRFNYVLHADVIDLIAHAIETDLTGIYNIASQGLVTLSDVATQLGLSIKFGTHKYDIGPIDSFRAASILPAFSRQSWETLNLFIDSLGSTYVGRGRLCGK